MAENEISEPRPARRVRDLARALDVSPVSVYRAIATGEVEAVRIGGAIRIPDRVFRKLTGASEAA